MTKKINTISVIGATSMKNMTDMKDMIEMEMINMKDVVVTIGTAQSQ